MRVFLDAFLESLIGPVSDMRFFITIILYLVSALFLFGWPGFDLGLLWASGTVMGRYMYGRQ